MAHKLPLSLFALLCALLFVSAHASSHVPEEVEDDDLSAAAAAAAAELAPAEEAAGLQQEASQIIPFNAYEFLAGEWLIQRQSVSFSAGVSAPLLPSLHWRLEKDNITSTTLLGHAWLNNSVEADASLQLRVEFEEAAAAAAAAAGSSSARVQTGADEDTLNTLAHLAFVQAKGGVAVSAGEWSGDELGGAKARYVLTVAGQDKFTLLVTPAEGASLAQAKAKAASQAKPAPKSVEEEEDLHVEVPASVGFPSPSALEGDALLYTFTRVKTEAPKTFMQKYGTFILLAGMLGLNVYMRSKQSGGVAKTAQQQLQAARAAASANRGAKKSGARVEEITESESTASKKDK